MPSTEMSPGVFMTRACTSSRRASPIRSSRSFTGAAFDMPDAVRTLAVNSPGLGKMPARSAWRTERTVTVAPVSTKRRISAPLMAALT
ncbi:hypothetical protein D3C83_106360 [compost metagenome]